MSIKKPLHRLPLDDWFDDTPHPHDSMPIAKDESWEDDGLDYEDDMYETIHEKMYKIATSGHTTIGGSESIQ